MTKTLSELNMPEPNVEFEVESKPISQFAGSKGIITGFEFKTLGTWPGVVLTLKEGLKDKEGKVWNKIHSSSAKVRAKMQTAYEQLGDEELAFTITSGKSANGTWYDIE